MLPLFAPFPKASVTRCIFSRGELSRTPYMRTFENFFYGVLRQCQAVVHHCGSMKAYSLDLTQKKMTAAVLKRGMPEEEMFA
jgi:hypothetical protein